LFVVGRRFQKPIRVRQTRGWCSSFKLARTSITLRAQVNNLRHSEPSLALLSLVLSPISCCTHITDEIRVCVNSPFLLTRTRTHAYIHHYSSNSSSNRCWQAAWQIYWNKPSAKPRFAALSVEFITCVKHKGSADRGGVFWLTSVTVNNAGEKHYGFPNDSIRSVFSTRAFIVQPGNNKLKFLKPALMKNE